MQCRDISFTSPQDNIAYDDVLLTLAQSDVSLEFLRFWESPSIFIVLGRLGREEVETQSIAIKEDKIPVIRRSSGGGTVVQGPGCLNYTLILSKDRNPSLADLRLSYAWISQKILTALADLGVEAYFRPTSDLALGIGEKKFSGNAQRRVKSHVLHHGTILYNFDLALISRYLQMPADMPGYRQQRLHKDFVANIPIKPDLFKLALSKVWDAGLPESPTDHELLLLKEIKKIL